MLSETNKYNLLFALAGAFFFLPFLGGVHLFDWDEINFAEISREMVVSGDFLRVSINFEPFYQKPPFFFWLQALAMKVFGVNEMAARLPNALCGVLSLALLFNMGKKLYHTRFGIIWAGVYLGSVLPFLYFKSGIIDPWFNLFIFLGLYFFILFYWKKEKMESIELPYRYGWYLFLGGLFTGLGILTKGPVAYLIACLTFFVYWVYQRFRFYVNVPQFLFFTLAALLVTGLWLGLETLLHGPDFMYEFNRYQVRLLSTADAGHRGFAGYHFVVLLVGCFPASIFAVRAFFRRPAATQIHQQDFERWMKFLFWTVLILFTLVRTKIVHYSSMCYFPLTFLAAATIDQLIEGKISFNRWMKAGLIAIGGLFVLATTALPFLGQQIELLKPLFAKDPFAMGNLEADVRWTGFEVIPGVWLLLILGYSMLLFRRQAQFIRGFQLLFGGTAVFVMLTLIFFIGRIEGYSQRAAIEFFQEKSAEDCYLGVHGYKSYVHLFYGRPDGPGQACFQEADCMERLLEGPIDKPVYIATKIHKAEDLKKLGTLREIDRKNGFVFFERQPE
jgi:4-amino-4-deoxy-L-arabinose transferase-like glycosyltransferase